MQSVVSCIRDKLLGELTKSSPRRLAAIENILMTKIEEIDRFYPWPALKESFSQDLEAVWAEQKRRGAQKK